MSRPANILLLGGAKRVSMARMLADAGRRLGFDPHLFSYEMDMRVPIAEVAQVVTGLRWRDPDVSTDIHALCAARSIGIVVPFVDGAVAVAARVAAGSDIFAPTGDPATAESMFDKVAAAALFERAGLPVPRTWHPGMDCRGLIAKPRHGSASKGIVSIDSESDLASLADPDEYLVQERVDNRREYTVDCYASVSDGRILAVSPRLRLEVSGGEVTRTVTVDRPDIRRLASRAIDALGLRGAITVQVLEDVASGRIMLMEINPRLGGGAVCSVHAGADIPLLIMAEAMGLPLEPMAAEPGVEIARYPQEVVFRP